MVITCDKDTLLVEESLSNSAARMLPFPLTSYYLPVSGNPTLYDTLVETKFMAFDLSLHRLLDK